MIPAVHKTLLRPRYDVASRVLDGTFTLLSAKGRQIYRLNESAEALWNAVGDGSTTEQVCAVLGRRFDVDPAVLRADVAGAIESLDGVLSVGPTVGHRGDKSDRTACGEGIEEDPTWGIKPFRALETWVHIFVDADARSDGVAQALDHVRDVVEPLCRAATTIDLDIDRTAWVRVTGSAERLMVRRDGTEVAVARSQAALREVLLAEINAAAIEHLEGSVGFHAGAVAFPAGVVVLPGHSNAGKSTLVTHLLQRGHGYLTDEVAALQLTSRQVTPFPKSVCVDPGAHALFSELAPPSQGDWHTWHVDPQTIGPGQLGAMGDVAAFVFPRFEAGHPVVMDRLSRSDALVALLENSFDFAATGAKGAALLLEIAAEVPCYTLCHGGQPEHLAVLEERFGRR